MEYQQESYDPLGRSHHVQPFDFQFFVDKNISLQYDNDKLTFTTSAISTIIENNLVNSPVNFLNFNLKYKIFPSLSFYSKITSQIDTSFFGIGGGEIYSQTIEIVDKIELTRVFENFKGDAFFPNIPLNKFKLVNEKVNYLDNDIKLKYSFLTYTKK